MTLTLTFKRLFLDILSLFLNNNVLCNIFLKKTTDYNLNKEIAYKILKKIPFSSKSIESFSDLGLDLESIFRIKLFWFKRHCSFM